jgi:hypothetical protein
LDLEEAGYDKNTGYGLVQAFDALVYTYTDPCEIADKDDDGHDAEACGGSDCDDNDPSSYPYASEICGDTIDQDCDGTDLPCPPDNQCLPKGENCSSHSECCSGRCHPKRGCK